MFLSRAALFAATVSVLATAGIASAQGTTAPKPAAKPAPTAKLPANVAARVDGVDITYADLSAVVKSWAGRPVLQQVVQSKIIEKQAKALGVTVTPAELAAEMKKIKDQQVEAQTRNGSMMTWAQIAERDGISDGYVKDNVRLGLLARKAYAKFLEQNVPSMDGQIKVAHILIANHDLQPKPDAKPPTPEEEAKMDADAKAKADQILADIKANKITFADAAKQMSADPGSGANGGEMGFAGKGAYVKPFEDAAFKLEKPGDITPEPVKSQFGYHIIKLIQKGSSATPAEKAAFKQQQIDAQMQNQQGIGQWIQYLVSRSKINYNAVVAKPVAPAKAPAAKPKP